MILEHKDDLNAFREAVRTWVSETAPSERSHEWQKAKGNVTVLTVCIPRGVLDDVHELE